MTHAILIQWKNFLTLGEVAVTGERILVVDDGADMRDFVINYVLKPNGFDYLEAHDGLEGFELLVAENPELILLDLQMPRLDGIGLLRKMKEHEITTPVVLMTFYGSEDVAIEVFRLGVRDYVQKPFTDDELLESIERALIETRLRRERESLTEQLAAANRDLQSRIRDFEMLHKVGRIVTNAPNANSLLSGIIEATAHITQVSRVYLSVLDERGKVLYNRAVLENGRVRLVNEQANNPTTWQVIESRQAAVSAPEMDRDTEQFFVHISAPLTIQGKPFGALTIVALADMATPQQLTLLSILADYAAIGLRVHGWRQ